MNLFINNNFIDTVGRNINVLQLIRQIAEDDDVIFPELISALKDHLDYVNSDMLVEDIDLGEHENAAIVDETLYASGNLLKAIFEELFPGDYTVVIDALVASVEASDDQTLRLDHNGLPVVEHQEEIDFSKIASLEVTAPRPNADIDLNAPLVETRPVAPFPGDSEGTQVLQSEVATLNSAAILGELRVDGRVIPVRQVTGKNGVLFSVQDLYKVIYNLQHDQEYLRQVLVEYRTSIDPEDILFNTGVIYLTVYGLAKLHTRLCYLVEWQPLVAKIVNQFTLNPYENVSFDLLGNQVG